MTVRTPPNSHHERRRLKMEGRPTAAADSGGVVVASPLISVFILFLVNECTVIIETNYEAGQSAYPQQTRRTYPPSWSGRLDVRRSRALVISPKSASRPTIAAPPTVPKL